MWTHNFLVDDLKLFASITNTAKKQIDLVTALSKGRRITLSTITKRKTPTTHKIIELNHLLIKTIKEGDNYKDNGIDENIVYVGPINKSRITKKYYDLIRKMWNSKLSSFNKVIGHNTILVSVFITSVGIIDWTINKIK